MRARGHDASDAPRRNHTLEDTIDAMRPEFRASMGGKGAGSAVESERDALLADKKALQAELSALKTAYEQLGARVGAPEAWTIQGPSSKATSRFVEQPTLTQMGAVKRVDRGRDGASI